MAHVLISTLATADKEEFVLIQKMARVAAVNVKLALGADETKRFEEDVANCVSGNENLAYRRESLWNNFCGMMGRMKVHMDEVQDGMRSVEQDLQACIGVVILRADTISVEGLSDGAKQKALELALKLIAQETRTLEMTRNNIVMSAYTTEFYRKEWKNHIDAMKKQAVLMDSAKTSLDAANETISRSGIALRTANENIALLEKKVAETSERTAQLAWDMQKLIHKKDDPDRDTWSKIQQKPLACLERTTKALKRASENKRADGDTLNSADCPALKTKLEALQEENNKLLEDKKNLLADRTRDKVDMERLTEQLARLRSEKDTEKSKKRYK